VGDDDDIAVVGLAPGIRHRRIHAGDNLRVGLAPAGHRGTSEVAPVQRVHEGPLHPLAFEDIGRLDDPFVGRGTQAEPVDEGLRRFLGALERGDDECGQWALEPTDPGCSLLGHLPPVFAQAVPGEPSVQDPIRVEDLPVTHEMDTVSGHVPSLRGGCLCAG